MAMNFAHFRLVPLLLCILNLINVPFVSSYERRRSHTHTHTHRLFPLPQASSCTVRTVVVLFLVILNLVYSLSFPYCSSSVVRVHVFVCPFC